MFQFRRGEMSIPRGALARGKKLDPKEVRAYLRAGALYGSYSLYAKPMTSYRAPMRLLPTISRCRGHGYGCFPERNELAALDAYLSGPHPDDEEEKSG